MSSNGQIIGGIVGAVIGAVLTWSPQGAYASAELAGGVGNLLSATSDENQEQDDALEDVQ
ncbi:hypothetical protein NLY39_11170 [Pseudomonas sp. KHPS1]|nr:hypothetical protein [Pseudomonas sp. KHPS1]ATH82296.1 hypothetical protein CO724_14440 [Pseudomonas mendocina]UTH38664.1 hypothetical protein NLY39_11170 [Pseudomonas sp. KHPS1]